LSHPPTDHRPPRTWTISPPHVRPDYFLCVEVLSALFRRLFLEMLVAAHDAGRLQFFGDHLGLANRAAFNAYIAPLRDID
jgi:hypothetical protein